MSHRQTLSVFDQAAGEKEISLAYIKETLSIYEESYMCLTRAFHDTNGVRGLFRVEHYPFIKPNYIDYMTAAMLCLYLSQLGYVYARLVADNTFPQVKTRLLPHNFFVLRDQGHILITGLKSVRFSNPIKNGDTCYLSMVASRSLQLKARDFIDIEFTGNVDACTGKLRIAIGPYPVQPS